MGRGVLRSCGCTAAILQYRLRVFHTSPISNEIVGMTKFKLSSDSSSVTERGTAAFFVDDYKTWSIS